MNPRDQSITMKDINQIQLIFADVPIPITYIRDGCRVFFLDKQIVYQ